MINKIIDGISVAINAEFGDDYEIYTESVEQGLNEPCFSILCLNPTNEQFLGRRYFRKNQFCIHYFPKGEEKNKEINEVRERLFECLELVTVDGDLCRGTNMSSETSDGVLSFFFFFFMFMYKMQEGTPTMESYDYSTDVKG